MDAIKNKQDEWMRSKWAQSKLARLFLLCMVSSILVAVLSGAAVAKYAVTIKDEGTKTIIYTSEQDPAKILNQYQIVLGANDTLTVSGLVNNEYVIQINRASLVRVQVDGAEKSVYVTDGTVQDALAKLNIAVDDNDFMNASLSEPVQDDMNIVINRVTLKTVEESTAIPYSVREIPTQTLKTGKAHVLQEGIEGQKTTTVQQTLVDGRVTKEQVLDEQVTASPVMEKVLVGNPNAPTSQLVPAEDLQLDANGNPVNYLKKVTGKATAYSALGKPTKLVPGAVAMNLSEYPRGTRLYIKTPDGSFIYGYSEVRDTGPAVRDGVILVDLFFGSYRESCLFGAKTVDIYVLP